MIYLILCAMPISAGALAFNFYRFAYPADQKRLRYQHQVDAAAFAVFQIVAGAGLTIAVAISWWIA